MIDGMASRRGSRNRDLSGFEITAEKIIVAVFKVLLPGAATRVEGIRDIADMLFSRQKNDRARNSMLHRLQESAELLAERLAPFESIELNNMPRAERDLAIEGVYQALEHADLSTSTVIKDNIDPG